MESNEIVSSQSRNDLYDESSKLISEIISENDSEKLKDLVSLFNINQSKKNIVRADIFSKLLDKISIQMVERLDKKSGEFSNKDLLDYLTAVRSAVDKSNILPENINMPIIQNNTQVNVNVDNNSLNRESRERIANAVTSILSKLNNNEVIDVSEEMIEVDDKD